MGFKLSLLEGLIVGFVLCSIDGPREGAEENGESVGFRGGFWKLDLTKISDNIMSSTVSFSDSIKTRGMVRYSFFTSDQV